jgi:lipoprotein-releasing system permease protein
MRFELFVALRYLLAPRRQAFISVISSVSTLGVAVGVTALVVALALMTGLQGELRDRILGSTAHVYVYKPSGLDDYRAEVERLRRVPGVVGAGPAIMAKALVSTDSGDAFITLKGIDPDLEAGVTDVARRMRQGSVEAIAPRTDGDLPGILIGQRLAQQLDVRVGDAVRMLTLQGTLTPGGMAPRLRRVRVAGIYELGLLEFDANWGFVSLDVAGRLAGSEAPELIQLRLADLWAAPSVAESIPARLGAGYVAQDWQDLNQSLFSALWIEKMAISITVGLIVIVAALQIVASLVLLVMEKSRDIAILKTMGATPRRISTIFMAQGLIIGLVGTAAGGALGVALCWVLDRYRLIQIPMDVYQIAYVPFVIDPLDFLAVVLSAVVICFAATLYPSRQASRLDPVQALRFE